MINALILLTLILKIDESISCIVTARAVFDQTTRFYGA